MNEKKSTPPRTDTHVSEQVHGMGGGPNADIAGGLLAIEAAINRQNGLLDRICDRLTNLVRNS